MLEDQLITQFGEINRVEITEDELECFESESDYVGKCLDMMIEAGSFITVCTQLYPSGADGWTRDEAIIGGLLVRIYKLIHVILDQTCQNRLEPAFAQSRLLFETVVNLYFLTEEHNPEAFRDFVGYSLRHEQRLIEKIRRNIHDRNGQVLPIEQRMVSSIERAFERAEMSEAEVKSWKKGPWSNRNLVPSRSVWVDGERRVRRYARCCSRDVRRVWRGDRIYRSARRA